MLFFLTVVRLSALSPIASLLTNWWSTGWISGQRLKVAWTARFEGLWLVARSPAGGQSLGVYHRVWYWGHILFKDLSVGAESTFSKCVEDNKTGMVDTSSWATFSSWPYLSRGVGLDDLERSLPTSMILWFCPSVAVHSTLQTGCFACAGTVAV